MTFGHRVLLFVAVVAVSFSSCSLACSLASSRGPAATVAEPPARNSTALPDLQGSPYVGAIKDLISRGVISGYADGSFHPDEPVTRQQFAKMIVLALGYSVSQTEVCPFSDVAQSVPGEYVDAQDPLYPDHYVAVCALHSITRGLDAGKFGPYGYLTRAQLITMVARAAELTDPATGYSPPFPSFPSEHYVWARRAAAAGFLDGLQGMARGYNFYAVATRGECAQLLYNMSRPWMPEQVSGAKRLLEQTLSKHGIPGGVVGVWVPGKRPLIVANGVTNVGAATPINSGAFFRAGSITKMLTATVVLQLVEEGKLALSDRLSRYLPTFPGAAEITIRQLLNHTSGVYDYTKDDDFIRIMNSDPNREWAPEDLVQIAAAHSADFSPGTSWRYSNTNYILLGMIVEQITGDSLAKEISLRIAQRLGLLHTYLAEDSTTPFGFSHAYTGSGSTGTLQDVTVLNPSLAWASGALITDVGDLSIFVKELAEGRLLTPEMQQQMFTWVEYGNGKDPPEAYGLGVVRLGSLIGHSGSIGGFESAAYYLPAERAVIIAWVNRYPTDAAAETIVRAIGGSLFPAAFGP